MSYTANQVINVTARLPRLEENNWRMGKNFHLHVTLTYTHPDGRSYTRHIGPLFSGFDNAGRDRFMVSAMSIVRDIRNERQPLTAIPDDVFKEKILAAFNRLVSQYMSAAELEAYREKKKREAHAVYIRSNEALVDATEELFIEFEGRFNEVTAPYLAGLAISRGWLSEEYRPALTERLSAIIRKSRVA